MDFVWKTGGNKEDESQLLIHKNDTEALLYVYDKVPITNIIILDNDKIYKLKNIKVDINLQYL